MEYKRNYKSRALVITSSGKLALIKKNTSRLSSMKSLINFCITHFNDIKWFFYHNAF